MIDHPVFAKSFSAGIPVPILGVPFDKVSLAETVGRIDQMILDRQPRYIVTPNVDFIVQAQEDVELRRILFDADLVLCDGTPAVWISGLLKNPLPERVAGSDLVPLLIRLAAEKGYRIFLLGASPTAAAKAVDNLQKQHPNLIIAGHYSPPFRPLLEMDHADIAARILQAKPDLLLVSFGCPKQEKWIQRNLRSLGVPVSIGVGATIDFLAGHMKRAPVWMQRTGTEWIFRLLQEPRRLFKRYAKDIWVFGWRILVQCSRSPRAKSRHAEPVDQIVEHSDPIYFRITLPRCWDSAAAQGAALRWEPVLKSTSDIVVDMSLTRFIDNTGAGALVALKKTLQARGRQLILVSPSQSIEHALNRMRLRDFFSIAANLDSAHRLLESQASEKTAPVKARTAAASSLLLWRGEITAANADEVRAATFAHLTASRLNQLVIDLSQLRFIDSTGVEVMLEAHRLARQKRVNLVFINHRPCVQNVLRHARFETLRQKLDAPMEPVAPTELVLSRQT